MMSRIYMIVSLLVLMAQPAAMASQGNASAADPRTTEAGLYILKEGGSATDAAIAMLLVSGIVEPQSSGIGGGGFLIHHDGKTGALTTIDGREVAPAAALPRRFMNSDGTAKGFREAVGGGLSVGVPGNIRLIETAHQKWGRLKWQKLFKPAIDLADNGFAISPALHARLTQMQPALADYPAIRTMYYDTQGQPLPVGSKIKNPELTALLKRIAKHGANEFYQGHAARLLSVAVANAPKNPARLTEADLIAYRTHERAPICSEYREYRVCSMGPPSAGGVALAQMLGMIERFDIKAYGPDDPRSWHVLGEAMRLAYADRDTYIADPDFVPVPVQALISPGYIAERSQLISLNKAMKTALPGKPNGYSSWRYAPASEVPSTTSFAAADSNGNVVAVTSTIEGPFGSYLMANGYHLNNELTDFSFLPERHGAPIANGLKAGKRPRSAMSPTIVYGPSGQPILALGSAGGPRIIMHIMKTLIGVIDWGLPAAEAVALPNIFLADQGLLVERNHTPQAVQAGLVKLGHIVTSAELTSKVNAVEWHDGVWHSVSDPRNQSAQLQP